MIDQGIHGVVPASGQVAATSSLSPERQEKLRSAAHEFEASLMQEFLKPLQKDPLFSEGNDDGDEALDDGQEGGEGSQSTLMSMGSEIFAKALSEHGGFGIASRILNQLGVSDKAAESSSSDSATVSGSPATRPIMNY
ncbi:hypothetical protein [Silvibacterium sp.]|uniref:hypothetical protein n=1 Tax=Silvibacterium sp. TaxID=1964179 RepID=UPI0039E29931